MQLPSIMGKLDRRVCAGAPDILLDIPAYSKDLLGLSVFNEGGSATPFSLVDQLSFWLYVVERQQGQPPPPR